MVFHSLDLSQSHSVNEKWSNLTWSWAHLPGFSTLTWQQPTRQQDSSTWLHCTPASCLYLVKGLPCAPCTISGGAQSSSLVHKVHVAFTIVVLQNVGSANSGRQKDRQRCITSHRSFTQVGQKYHKFKITHYAVEETLIIWFLTLRKWTKMAPIRKLWG